MSNSPLIAVRTIMSLVISKVFVRFACVALVAAMVQVLLISLPSAQTISTQTPKELQILNKQIGELQKARKRNPSVPIIPMLRLR